ncbi:hypothetical protein E2I21_23150 [Alcaligenaceae bacterium SAGV5]|nr:hypothetical protein [Alcaligenaceae bacterium SAGV5]
MEDFWQTCAQTLEQELTPQQYSAWIRPLVPLAFDEAEAVLRVAAPNRFKLDWVRSNFSGRIESLAAQWFQRPVQVKFELDAPRMAAPLRPPAPGWDSRGGGGALCQRSEKCVISCVLYGTRVIDAQPVKLRCSARCDMAW